MSSERNTSGAFGLLLSLDNNKLTNLMEQSPWEANRFSASQKIPRILCKPKVHCRLQKSPRYYMIN
jgi:hypothetical protein